MRSASLIAAALAAAILTGCAGPPSPPETKMTAAPDTTGAALYDGMYIELVADVISRVTRIEARSPGDIRLAEARAMLRVAEEQYLRGNALAAVEYLQRIDSLLKDVP